MAEAERSPFWGTVHRSEPPPLRKGLSAGCAELARTPWQGVTPRGLARTPPVGSSLQKWLENHSRSSAETSQRMNGDEPAQRVDPAKGRLADPRAPCSHRPLLAAPATGEEGQEPSRFEPCHLRVRFGLLGTVGDPAAHAVRSPWAQGRFSWQAPRREPR